jgi:N,N'-diacetyllegionaminate synthase
MKSKVRIGTRDVGSGCPAFIVAEIGINHNGDMALAKAMIEAAAAAGADSVKFQNYRTEDFISDRLLLYKYISQGREVIEPQFDMFKRFELTPEMLVEYKAHCVRCGVVFHSTPTSEDGVRDLAKLGAPVLKNGSDYLGHLPLIQCMARTGLPTVLSTGMATLAEVDDAVRAFRDAGGGDLILLHCTSSYPTPPNQVHLRKLATLASAFGYPVGYSDHTIGVEAALGAVALGACWIEKHFTLDRGLPGPDHSFSSDPVEFKTLVKAIRHAESNLGSSFFEPTVAEGVGRNDFRLSCVAARDFSPGHVLSLDDIAFRRPGTGLPPKAFSWLTGQRLQQPVLKGEVFSPTHFA